MSHDSEERCKILRKSNFLLQKFGEFWSEDSGLKNLHFNVSLSCKYITFDLKKYGGVIFHETEELCKIWRKNDLWFGQWHDEFGKFSPDHSKVSKLGLLWNPFIQKRKYMSLKFTEELNVMTMKNDAKFKKELTCHFKTDIRNSTNFDPTNFKNVYFNGLLLTKIYNVWA